VKVTEKTQVASGFSVPDVGHVVPDVSWKSPGLVPVRVTLLMVRAALELVLVSVEVLAALVVPTVTEAKFSDAGNSVAVTTPVPESEMV
jgi:hypothetical protein